MENEKRLIDAHELIRNHGSDVTNWDKPYAVFISSIENAPTVDAVEVVRCKECKHCIYVSRVMGDVRCGKLHTDYIKENSFCSNGERKDNG